MRFSQNPYFEAGSRTLRRDTSHYARTGHAPWFPIASTWNPASITSLSCMRPVRSIGVPPTTKTISFNPNRSLGFGQIARLCHAACFSPSRRRSGLRRGVFSQSETDSACLMTDLGSIQHGESTESPDTWEVFYSDTTHTPGKSYKATRSTSNRIGHATHLKPDSTDFSRVHLRKPHSAIYLGQELVSTAFPKRSPG